MYNKNQYDVEKYQFAKLISEAFGVDDLSGLHKLRSDLLPVDKLDFSTESKTKFHETFYKKLNSPWDEMHKAYTKFIQNEIAPYFEEDFIYQTFPTFRVHLPDDQAIHQWHYDSDPKHMHPQWEINIQIAITDMFNSSATWIESVPGLRDFQPMDIEYGEYVIFDGSRCMHGNKINEENKTRLSFDFRVMPIDKYVHEGRNSVTSGRKFVVGDYYRLFKK